MSVSRTSRRWATSALAAGVAVLTLATPAAANPAGTAAAREGGSVAATRCPSGWFCVWPRANFHGRWVGGKSHRTCYTPFRSGHSVSNHLGVKIRVYSRTGCRGSYFDLRTGHYSNPTPFNVRSVRTY